MNTTENTTENVTFTAGNKVFETDNKTLSVLRGLYDTGGPEHQAFKFAIEYGKQAGVIQTKSERHTTKPFTPAKIIIKTGAISSTCTPKTAQELVEKLRADGWPAQYGGQGNGSILPNTPDFAEAFYAALDEIARSSKRR